MIKSKGHVSSNKATELLLSLYKTISGWYEVTLIEGGIVSFGESLACIPGRSETEPTPEKNLVSSVVKQCVLGKLYCGHQGITKCWERARQSVWWPGINRDVEVMISKCLICCKHKQQNVEPLKSTPFPEYPWQKVATDLFEWKKTTYVLVVAYYSWYIEVCSFRGTTSASIIHKLKIIFARHDIPESLMSPNSPHKSFPTFWIYNITSSPNYAQANGKQNEQWEPLKLYYQKWWSIIGTTYISFNSFAKWI